jgi:hypothetical protein
LGTIWINHYTSVGREREFDPRLYAGGFDKDFGSLLSETATIVE